MFLMCFDDLNLLINFSKSTKIKDTRLIMLILAINTSILTWGLIEVHKNRDIDDFLTNQSKFMKIYDN